MGSSNSIARQGSPTAAVGLAAILIVALGGCSGDSAAPRIVSEDAQVTTTFAGGLRQRVTVTYPNADQRRRDFRIDSRLFNDGTAPVEVRYRVCFLDDENLQTTMQHEAVVLPGCLAVQARHVLAPSDSSDGVFYWGRNLSGSGSYTIHVRQSLDPEHWTTVQLQFD